MAKKLLIVLGYIAVFFASGALSYKALSLTNAFKKDGKVAVINSEQQVEVPQFESAFEPLDPDVGFNILLLGYGGAGHDGGSLSDVLIVANINPDKRQVSLISIPRDTWVSIPIQSDKSQNYKINAAFAIGGDDRKYPLKEPQYKGKYGGGRLAKDVVEKVIGMPIDYYVAVNFSGFEEAIDILGGIDVVVPKTFDDFFYPVKGLENETCGMSPEEIADVHEKYSGFDLEKQFECRYEHIHFDAGKVYMNGEEALKYVRSRHSEQHGGDFARSERQQALIVAMKDKIFSLGVLDDIVPFFNKLSNTFTTDIDEKILQTAVDTFGGLSGFTVSMTRLNEENVLQVSRSSTGQFILIPKEGEGNWEGVHKYITESAGE